MKILNNTFIGTLLAGLVLTFIGFQLYKKQKQVDIKFEDLRKLRDSASGLFAEINYATTEIGGLFNVYDQQTPIFTKILQHAGGEIEAGLIQKIQKELGGISKEVTKFWRDLSSQLAIKNEFDVKVDIFGQNMTMLNLYMNAASITVPKLKVEEVKEWREGWEKSRALVVAELNKILE